MVGRHGGQVLVFEAGRDPNRGLFYEDRIHSLDELGLKLRSLDQDAGIRLIWGRGSGLSMAFVTRFGPTYTVMIYGVTRGGLPGKRRQTLEQCDPVEVEMSLRGMVKGKLQAWIY